MTAGDWRRHSPEDGVVDEPAWLPVAQVVSR